MYLGQCLQMQSNLQDGIKVCPSHCLGSTIITNEGQTALVPFRQCKLTELLFSNSFPSSNQMSRGLHPQKAIMIVTADPLGDFNATSQILRYSALAREVTVPRVPSVTESVLSAVSSKERSVSGRTSPNFAQTEELERAAAEITRLTKDCHALAVRLAEEEIARSEVESRLSATEDRCVMIEQEVREECWAEMDEMMEEERKRWQKAWDDQVSNLSCGYAVHSLTLIRPVEMTSIWIRRLSWFLKDLVVSPNHSKGFSALLITNRSTSL